jgi:RNA polymerase sigma-70 factor (ECF subfamily)
MQKEAQYKAAVEANKDRLYRICCCYVRDDEARKDVFQEVLIHLWKGLDSFEGKSEISTWMYRIAVNTCLGYVRTEKRRRRLFDENAQVDHETIPDEIPDSNDPGPEQDLERLYGCIDQLQPLQKTLVSLYLEDLSTTEMADVLGISEANVRVKIHRIKKQLKEMMNGESHGSR